MQDVGRLRAAVQGTFDIVNQPVPFFYCHLITIISGIYLPLMSWCGAVDIDLADNTWQQVASGFGVSFSAVLALNLSIIGLHQVGEQLSDPCECEQSPHNLISGEVSQRLLVLWLQMALASSASP